MKKYAYILGSIEMMVGVLLLCTTSIITKTLPLLGRVAYQAAAGGSYALDDYRVSFPLVNGISFVLIMIGIVQILVFALKNTKE